MSRHTQGAEGLPGRGFRGLEPRPEGARSHDRHRDDPGARRIRHRGDRGPLDQEGGRRGPGRTRSWSNWRPTRSRWRWWRPRTACCPKSPRPKARPSNPAWCWAGSTAGAVAPTAKPAAQSQPKAEPAQAESRVAAAPAVAAKPAAAAVPTSMSSGLKPRRQLRRPSPRRWPQQLSKRPILAPSAERIVQENKLDPAEIAGTGKDGRITKGDALMPRWNRARRVKPRPHPPSRWLLSRGRSPSAKSACA